MVLLYLMVLKLYRKTSLFLDRGSACLLVAQYIGLDYF